jgi:hypothetical protein
MSWGMVDPVAGSGGWMVEEYETALRAMKWPLVIGDDAFGEKE